jgi:hypothetical protein
MELLIRSSILTSTFREPNDSKKLQKTYAGGLLIKYCTYLTFYANTASPQQAAIFDKADQLSYFQLPGL